MTRLALLLPLLPLLALAACETQAERIAEVHDQCAAYGWQNGTPDMAECMEREWQSRRAKGLALTGMGTAMMSAGAPQPARRAATCQTIRNSVNTSTVVCN